MYNIRTRKDRFQHSFFPKQYLYLPSVTKILVFFFLFDQVLISGKEQPHLQLSPAMDAAIAVFKCVTGLFPTDGTGMYTKASEAKPSSVTFIVGYSQALTVIGKEGATIRAIEKSSDTTLGILSPGLL